MKKDDTAALPVIPADQLLSTDEVAKVLLTTRDFVNRILNAGLLLPLYFGRNKKVPTSMLNDFIRAYAGRDIIAEVERIEAERKGVSA